MANPDLRTSNCPLCENEADYFLNYKDKSGHRNYYKCKHCYSVHLATNEILNAQEEILRYKMHNNDVEDERYQKFVSPITDSILQEQLNTADGLDYGCGPGPVITHLLRKNGFKNIHLFDPYFYPQHKLLNKSYHFIICCEVIEHFSNPKKEFQLIKNLLKHEGKLYGKTELIPDEIKAGDFQNWWYKNDPTHCFFYSRKTLSYLTSTFGFSKLEMEDKFFILSN
jgi:SAM-dependent methyltransferase